MVQAGDADAPDGGRIDFPLRVTSLRMIVSTKEGISKLGFGSAPSLVQP